MFWQSLEWRLFARWSLVAAIMAGATAIPMAHLLLDENQPSASVTPLSQDQPPYVSRMLKQFRDATPQEVAVLKGRGYVAPWSQNHVYVAINNVRLAPTDEPFTLVLPEGYVWFDGPLARTEIIHVAGDINGEFAARQLFDWRCRLEQLGRLNNCLNDETPRGQVPIPTHLEPATDADLRRVTTEFMLEPAKNVVKTDALAVQLGFTEHSRDTAVIFGPHAKVAGGEVGAATLLMGTVYGNQQVYDPFCLSSPPSAADPARYVPPFSRHYETLMICRGHYNE